MRIALITVGDLKLSPYIHLYLNLMEKNAIDYDLIYWNRDGNKEDVPENYIVYEKKSDYAKPRICKLWDFIGYIRFVKKRFQERTYDKCIVFTSQTAILLRHVLKRLPYLLDIRDASSESNKLYFNALDKIIENSEFTVISSDGFRQVLPHSEKYRLGHNIPLELIDEEVNRIDTNVKIIRFGYFGIIRDFEGLSKIIDRCGNNEILELHFYGRGQAEQKLRDYASSKGFKNVIFHGSYNLVEKPDMLGNIDIICNYYESRGNKLAVTNKYYDSIFSGKPQIVNQDFFDNINVEKYAVGIGLNANDSFFADKILEYYRNIDSNRFYESCVNLKKKYIAEYECFMNSILTFCLEKL